ncbi:MAG: CHAT domain-containing protein, partial [Leptolyngbya sp. SIO1D8]|nr:CHAT domain-containing protein [Leptolyngbya sp. SIO1D8]
MKENTTMDSDNSWDLQTQIEWLNQKVDAFIQQAEYNQAIQLCLETYQYSSQILEEHPDVAIGIFVLCLDKLGELYQLTENYSEAELCYLKVLELRSQVLGEEHPHVAVTLNNLASLSETQENSAEAEAYYFKALEISLKNWEDDHFWILALLEKIVSLCLLTRDFECLDASIDNIIEWFAKTANSFIQSAELESAIQLYNFLGHLSRQILEENHPNAIKPFVISLSSLAELYQTAKNYSEAESYYQRILEIRRQAQGEEHFDVAATLVSLASLYEEMENPIEAENYYLQALEIYQKDSGNDHPEVATIYNNLVKMHVLTGNFKGLGALMDTMFDSIGIFPEGGPFENIIATLSQASKLVKEGQYTQALKIAKEGERKFQDFLEEHSNLEENIISMFGNLMVMYDQLLGMIYMSLGNYSEGIPLLQHAIDIQRKLNSDDSPLDGSNTLFAKALNYLAGAYYATGNIDQAIQLNEEAIMVMEKAASLFLDQAGSTVFGEAAAETLSTLESGESIAETLISVDATVADIRNSLSLLYGSNGEYDKAHEMIECTIQAYEKNGLKSSQYYALALSNLGCLYLLSGDFKAAEEFTSRAMNLYIELNLVKHPNFLIVASNWAELLRKRGACLEASVMLGGFLIVGVKKASESKSNSFRELIPILRAMALVSAALGLHDEDKSLALLKQVEDSDYAILSQIISVSSEQQTLNYLRKSRFNLVLCLSLLLEQLFDSSTAIREGFEIVLRRKGFLVESLSFQRSEILQGSRPDLAVDLQALSDLRTRIAQATLAGKVTGSEEDDRRLLADWNTQRDRLEAELARQIPEVNLARKLQDFEKSLIVKALPKDAVLVEFISFEVFDFKAVAAKGEKEWKPDHYMAFVLSAETPDQIHLVDLGEVDAVDQMIATFRTFLTREKEDADRFGRAESPLSEPLIENGHELRATIFDPLLPAIGRCKRLFLAPDGDLSRLPFEVLPAKDGQYLIDHYTISYFSSGRDVLRIGAPSTGEPTPPIVVADPDFDLGNALSSASGSEKRSVSKTAAQVRDRTRQSHDWDRGMHFGPLAGTRLEGERIGQLLGVKPWLDADVRETPLKACRSPQILHIATHGFFLPNQKHNPNEDHLNTFGMISSSSNGAMERLSANRLENPLLRSGLALAGANTWLKDGALPEDAEDAILTAEDVTGMNLLSTEMVVLSACETGLGEVQTGEGVFGLRRAFVLAGAKTLVMSLWKVPDRQTQMLMEDFYERILAGHPRSEALR